MIATQSHDLLTGLMTKAEAAKQLRHSTRSLDRWHTDRTGPPRFLVGGMVVYDRGDVNAWLAAQKENTTLR